MFCQSNTGDYCQNLALERNNSIPPPSCCTRGVVTPKKVHLSILWGEVRNRATPIFGLGAYRGKLAIQIFMCHRHDG